MALKSIVDVEINDSDFQRYAAEFAKYQAALKSAPGLWTDAAAASASAAAAAASMGASVAAALFGLHRAHKEGEDVAESAARGARSWGSMAESAHKFTSRVIEATRSLLRWGELTGVVSGILGMGGLFGVDRLARSAGGQRREALGLGVTPGEAKAFDVDYGRVVDPSAFLGGVNEALHDVTKRVWLYGAGMTEEDLRGKDTAQVGSELLTHLKKIADQTPDAIMGNVLTARHLDQFMTLEDFQRLKNTQANELDQYKKNFDLDTHELQLSREQAKAWQDLQVQLHRAGQTIENTLIRGLTPLAPEIEKLSLAFTKLVEDLLASKAIKGWIDDLAEGIKWLGTFIGSQKFRDDAVSFMNEVGELAKKVGEFVVDVYQIVDAIAGAVRSIKDWSLPGLAEKGGVNGPLTDDNPDAPGSPAFNAKRFGTPEGRSLTGTPGRQQEGGGTASTFSSWMPWNWHMQANTPAPTQEQKARFDTLEQKENLPPGLLNSVMQTESGGDPNATSAAGAKGQFQLMDATARQYGVTDPRDFAQSSEGAARYLHKLIQEFHGDLTKAAAGYNWGEANVEKDVAQYGDRWREHLPDETARYVMKVETGVIQNPQPKMNPARPSVTVNVNNNTGGAAYISSSQLVPGY